MRNREALPVDSKNRIIPSHGYAARTYIERPFSRTASRITFVT